MLPNASDGARSDAATRERRRHRATPTSPLVPEFRHAAAQAAFEASALNKPCFIFAGESPLAPSREASSFALDAERFR